MSKKASHIINLSSFILKISYAIARLNSEALFFITSNEKMQKLRIFMRFKRCAYTKKILLSYKIKMDFNTYHSALTKEIL